QDEVLGLGDHYKAHAHERIQRSSSCERWELVLQGASTEGWSPKIEKRGPTCCPEGRCLYENQPLAVHLAVVDAIERKDAKAISKWIHPVRKCGVKILDDGHSDDPYIREAKLGPDDTRSIVSGELRMEPHSQ